MKRIFLILSFALFAFSSCSRTVRSISVSADGTVTFVPDMAEISVTVRNKDLKMNEATRQTKETVLKIYEICQKYGVEENDIKTSHVNSSREYRWDNSQEKQVFDGYSSSQNTVIVFKQLDKFDDFTSELFDLNLYSVHGIEFDHSERNKYEAEANLVALDHAKETAEKMAERMNVKVKRVLFIADFPYEVENTARPEMMVMRKSMDSSNGISASPGILTVKKSVSVRFEIN